MRLRPLQQVGKKCLGNVKGSQEIHVQHSFDRRVVEIIHSDKRLNDPGIIDDAIDGTESGDHQVRQALHCLPVRNICNERREDRSVLCGEACSFVQTCSIQVDARYLRASCEKQEREFAPDPASSAGDHDDLAVNFHNSTHFGDFWEEAILQGHPCP